jgi:hypothetical protein
VRRRGEAGARAETSARGAQTVAERQRILAEKLEVVSRIRDAREARLGDKAERKKARKVLGDDGS